MKLPNDRWVEIEPCVYQLRAYTPEQIERLDQRPTEMINAALGRRTLALSSHHSPTPGE